MSSSPEYNLFIKPTTISESIAGKDDKTTEYIILQNNTFISQHIDMLSELKEMKAQNDELEEFNEKLERGKGCIQGIAKNQYLLNIEKSKSIKFYKAQLKMCFMNYLYSNIFILPWLIMALFNIIFKIKFALIIITCTVQGKTFYKQYIWYKNLHKNEDIHEIEKEIKVLDTSSDTLHELVDNF